MKRLRTVKGLIPALLLAVLVCIPTASVAQRPPGNPFPDGHGYRIYDQDDAECGFAYIDIASGGTEILFTASGADPAEDDGGAVIALGEAFELYGESLTSLVVSSNGYIGGASTLGTEDGGDFSNDATLPAIPDNAVGTPLRILPYHDELSGFISGGAVYHQYFATCPRGSEALGAEPCTVIQWSDWALRGSGDTFDLQAVLYHDSLEIVSQIRPGAAPLTGGTMGIQNRHANVALQHRPEEPLTTDSAICVFEPRFPPGGTVADLDISNSDTVEIALPGQQVIYEIGLRNRGPSPSPGTMVDNPLPTSLVNCTWSCLSSDGSFCDASGTGSIASIVDLLPGGWVDYLFTCDTAPFSAAVVHTVSATPPAGTADPVPENNSATDINLVGAGRVPASLMLERDDTELILVWSTSCLISDTDYAVYEGTLGSFTTHLPITCSTSGQLTHSLPTPPGNLYYLVVPGNSASEGSYGHSSSGQERPASVGACFPQVAATCP